MVLRSSLGLGLFSLSTVLLGLGCEIHLPEFDGSSSDGATGDEGGTTTTGSVVTTGSQTGGSGGPSGTTEGAMTSTATAGTATGSDPYDPCIATTCPEGNMCVVDRSGQPRCVPAEPDPCALIRCRAGFVCEVTPDGTGACVPGGEPGSVCQLPPEVGPCDAAFPRFFHNAKTGRCEAFTYGGCGGNGNNFTSLGECEMSCGGGTDPCGGACKAPQQACQVDPQTGEAFCADTCEGVSCDAGNHCELVPVECVRAPCPPTAQCVPDVAPPQCDLPMDPGPCKAAFPRFFHNSKTNQCEPFIYGGCAGNENNFETLEDCQKTCPGGDPSTDRCQGACLPTQTCEFDEGLQLPFCADSCELTKCDRGQVCELQPVQCIRAPCPPVARCVVAEGSANPCVLLADPGPCDAAIPRFFHSRKTGLCESFIYGGCGGNANNFATQGDCEAKCGTMPSPYP